MHKVLLNWSSVGRSFLQKTIDNVQFCLYYCNMSIETLVKEFQKLSVSEKVRFLQLIEKVEEEGSLSLEWKNEIKRRWQAFETGENLPVDGQIVEQRLAQKHGIQL